MNLELCRLRLAVAVGKKKLVIVRPSLIQGIMYSYGPQFDLGNGSQKHIKTVVKICYTHLVMVVMTVQW